MTDDQPFRDAPARPQALVALAEAAKAAPAARVALSQDALHAPGASQRLELALGLPLYTHGPRTRVVATTVCYLAAFACFYAIFSSTHHADMFAAYALAAALPSWFVLRRTRPPRIDAELRRRLAADTELPFPVDGYDAWLASEIPIIEVHLRGELDHALVAGAARGVKPNIGVDWTGERTFRLIVPPLLYLGRFLTGDRRVWNQLAQKMLVPIHQDVGIERVAMGGSMRVLRT